MKIITHYLSLPTICLICEMTFKGKAPLCKRCEQQIQYLKNVCYACAAPCSHKICQNCVNQGSTLHRLYVGYPYQDPMKQLINEFKFKDGLDLCHYLAEMILAILPPEAFETQCLVPIPLHRKKLMARGYNQSLLLTKKLSQLTGIGYQTKLCQKIQMTRAQSKLEKKQRQLNLIDSFEFKSANFKHVSLIDDVTTTGSTLKTLAKGLMQTGITKVDAWVICKA
jgi:ComF family protein